MNTHTSNVSGRKKGMFGCEMPRCAFMSYVSNVRNSSLSNYGNRFRKSFELADVMHDSHGCDILPANFLKALCRVPDVVSVSQDTVDVPHWSVIFRVVLEKQLQR